MEKKTAVEWLAKQLEAFGDPHHLVIEWQKLDELVEQTKQKEKEQIANAWIHGVLTQDNTSADEYYEKIYGRLA